MNSAPASMYRRDITLSIGTDDVAAAINSLNAVGFVSFDSLVSPQQLSVLRSEAFARQKTAVPVSGRDECVYQAHLASLGKAGTGFLSGRGLSGLLGELFDIPLRVERNASCYTYYQPGDCLGPHLDHPTQCRVTVILYLDVVRPEAGAAITGLELRVYGDAYSENAPPRVILPTRSGSLVIGLGSSYRHERPTLQAGEFLTALTACYSLAAP